MSFNNLTRKLFYDKAGKLAIIQLPNVPLGVWLVALILSKLTTGSLGAVFGLISSTALVVWSVMEIMSGSSVFRKMLGWSVLLLFIASRI